MEFDIITLNHIKYGKRPVVIYIKECEFKIVTLHKKSKIFKVYHNSYYGCYNIGYYYYKRSYSGVVMMRKCSNNIDVVEG